MLRKTFLIWIGIVLTSLATQSFVRFPAVSGQFYPASPTVLKSDIERYLFNAVEGVVPQSSKLLGMIVPHAGYQFSGQTAAYAYNILKNHKVDVIVLVGPYHQDNFPGVSIWPQGTWTTPLGEVKIDEDFAKSIQNQSKDFNYDYQIHIPEHSLEVQIPFIQVVAKDIKVVPILISDIRYSKSLAQALYKSLRGRSALVIASTDLSHYHPDEMARMIDQRTQDNFQKLSPDTFRKAYQAGEIELCGAAAVLTLLELNQLAGVGEFTNLHYANSGDQFSDKSNVVGYNASIISTSDKIPLEQGRILLNFAKDTLNAYITNKTSPTFMADDPILQQNRAVFVTLRDKQGNLRGCIGQYDATEPLYRAVQHMTIDAATKDDRFQPVTLSELKGVTIEISVLDAPVKVDNESEIILGTHGVIVAQGDRSGVFLPEVAQSFSKKEEFLSELCSQKAKLPRDCWRNPLTQIKVFSAQTISEKG